MSVCMVHLACIHNSRYCKYSVCVCVYRPYTTPQYPLYIVLTVYTILVHTNTYTVYV